VTETKITRRLIHYAQSVCAKVIFKLLQGKEASVLYVPWDMSNYNSENAYLFGHIKATLLECSFLKKGKHSESCR
jgi:hypothetical protein